MPGKQMDEYVGILPKAM